MTEEEFSAIKERSTRLFASTSSDLNRLIAEVQFLQNKIAFLGDENTRLKDTLYRLNAG
jgi:hypothetical protein